MDKTQTEKELEKTKAQLLKEKAKQKAIQFKNELNKSIVTAITAAFGFLIAISWKELISELVTKATQASPVKGKLITAITVTIISVIGIIIVSEFSAKKDKN